MTDRIVLQGVSARGTHGVLDFEKRDGQTFVVDLTMVCDLQRAGRTDDLAATVNYAEVADDVVARITGPSFDLIERLAEVIADDVLCHDLVESVEVVVHKPEAPVGHPFTDVQVRVERTNAAHVVVALGSNLGDRGQTLTAAVQALRDLPGLTVASVSSIVETDPVGGPEQGAFLNLVVELDTTLDARGLLGECRRLEAAAARVRLERWGPRTLDVDVLWVDGEVVDEPDLQVPHPRMGERRFVLAPLADLAPDLVDPDQLARAEGEVRAVGSLEQVP